MLAAPSWQGIIWLHSPNCGTRAMKHPGYCGVKLGTHWNPDSHNSYCRRLARKHQCTVRGAARFALQPEASLEATPTHDAEVQEMFAVSSGRERARGVLQWQDRTARVLKAITVRCLTFQPSLIDWTCAKKRFGA